MTWFRAYLAIVVVCLAAYTLVVGFNHGWHLLPVFFSNVAAFNWSGQFNLDFATYLGMSAIWVAWRHHFTAGAMALGVVAFFCGMMFLAPYLLWASAKAGGDPRILLLGKVRASR